MFRYLVLVLISLSISAFGQAGPTNCNYYNTGTLGPYTQYDTDATQHSSGGHVFNNYESGSCTYIGVANSTGPTGCGVTAQANSGTAGGDIGTVSPVIYSHYSSILDQQGSGTGNDGLGAAAQSEGVIAYQSCVTGTCSINGISISLPKGVGGSISFSKTPLWSDQHPYTNNCKGETLATAPPVCQPSGQPPYPPPPNEQWFWQTSSCSWILGQPGCGSVPCSPLIIDTLDHGFVFGDPKKGAHVSFDMKGDGTLQKVSWPKVGSGNAWLVYDRDGDGVIKDGTELFGNFTPHADGETPENPGVKSDQPNGFLALQWYDHPAQGGDGNLIIDKHDAIWTKLRVWIDEHCYRDPDHQCQSRPNELHTLESVGIRSISAFYTGNRLSDAVGNDFRYLGVLNPDAEDTPDMGRGNRHHTCCELHQKSSTDKRQIYDVYLKTK